LRTVQVTSLSNAMSPPPFTAQPVALSNADPGQIMLPGLQAVIEKVTAVTTAQACSPKRASV
jgi:hypothetical protein